MNRNVPLSRTSRLEPGGPLARHAHLAARVPLRAARLPLTAGNGKNAPARSGTTSGRGESFPPDVADLIDARDQWCVHCGSPYDLQRHHRRIRGMGGDGRDHTHCACNGVRLCLTHHAWVHSAAGRAEAEAEGLIVPRATIEPWTHSVLVHLADREARKWPACDGQWADEAPGRDAA